jgi:hypothetical protein
MRTWLLEKDRLPAPRRQIEALQEMNFGLTRPKVREYLRTIEDLGDIEIKSDIIDLGRAHKELDERNREI